MSPLPWSYNEPVKLQTLGGLALQGSSLRRPKPLLLLTYLVLEGAKDRHHLAELFWPDAAEPLNSLRVALAQLRAAAPGALEDGEGGLGAKVEADAERLLRALDANDSAKATDLYRGAFLSGFYLAGLGSELEEWVYSTREFLGGRVREEWLELAERDAAVGDFRAAVRRAETALGLPGVPPPELEGWERLYRLLVAGSSAKASELQREAQGYGVALSFTRDEARQQLCPRAEIDPGGKLTPHNLPGRATSFIGRDLELIEFAKLLADPGTRLITLVGVGGVGKTRLAIQAAYGEVYRGRFTGGVYFVALDALSNPSLVPTEIAGVLGFSLPGSGEPLVELTQALVGRHLLLLLDNYEHLIAGVRALTALLQACPMIKLLVTSRERLNLEGEQLFQAEGLPLPDKSLTPNEADYQDAVQLFMQRAKRVKLDFTLDKKTLPHVLTVCRLLEGSPLGIELAAAWLRLIPKVEIAAEIERGSDFLVARTHGVADRHRSLRATFEHSWQLLTPREQEVLGRLSVFVGGFTREAASRVAGASIPLLASLVDKSLLRVLEGGRYDRHPLIYGYTREKLAARPEHEATVRATHAGYFLGLAEANEARHRGEEQVGWLRRLEDEHDNLRAALAWTLAGGDLETGLRLAAALYHFWYYRSHPVEGGRWLDRALEVSRVREAWRPLRSRLLSATGVLAGVRGDNGRAVALFRERLALARDLGDLKGQAAALNSLGIMTWEQQDYSQAQTLLEASMALRRELGQPELMAPVLNNLGLVALAQGKLSEAAGFLEEELALCRKLGDEMGIAAALSNLGATVLDAGNATRAGTLFEEALPHYRNLGDQDGLAHCLEGFAAVAASQGHAEAAAKLCGAADALRETAGVPLNDGDASRRERRLAPAKDALGEAGFAAAQVEGRTLTLEEALAAVPVIIKGTP